MKVEMRQKLAREPFAEKVRKVAQLIRLAKTFPRRPRLTPAPSRQMMRTGASGTGVVPAKSLRDYNVTRRASLIK